MVFQCDGIFGPACKRIEPDVAHNAFRHGCICDERMEIPGWVAPARENPRDSNRIFHGRFHKQPQLMRCRSRSRPCRGRASNVFRHGFALRQRVVSTHRDTGLDVLDGDGEGLRRTSLRNLVGTFPALAAY